MANSPAQLAARMSERQARTLMDLSVEAYQPKLFSEELTAAEAARRIKLLKSEIELADSF